MDTFPTPPAPSPSRDVWHLRFEGSSDDTFGETNLTQEDHDDCGGGTGRLFRVRHSSGTLLVYGQYAPRFHPLIEGSRPCSLGHWLIGILRDEDIPWPSTWRIETDHRTEIYDDSRLHYSPALHIFIPGGEKPTVEYVGSALS